jgi:hypothetical protein
MFKFTLKPFYLLLLFGLVFTACSRAVIATEQQSAADTLLAALAAEGATLEKGGEISQPFFGVTGQSIRLNGSEIQLFVYADEAAAKAEAEQVSPEGTAVGPNMMMWLATPHFFRADETIALYIGDDAHTLSLLEAIFGPQFAGDRGASSDDDIGVAALVGLEEIGWDVVGGGFTAEVVAVEGDYARVTVHSTNPPGGFAAFMKQQDGQWELLTQGSAFNPAELQALGIPQALIEWRPASE